MFRLPISSGSLPRLECSPQDRIGSRALLVLRSQIRWRWRQFDSGAPTRNFYFHDDHFGRLARPLARGGRERRWSLTGHLPGAGVMRAFNPGHHQVDVRQCLIVRLILRHPSADAALLGVAVHLIATRAGPRPTRRGRGPTGGPRACRQPTEQVRCIQYLHGYPGAVGLRLSACWQPSGRRAASVRADCPPTPTA